MHSIRRPANVAQWGLLCLACALALSAVTDVVTGNFIQALIAAVICSAPLLIYVTFRWPLIFPFGVYAAIVPIDNILLISGGLTITKIVGIVAAGALLIGIFIRRRALSPGPAWAAWAVAIAWMAITTVWSVNPEASEFEAVVMLTLFLTYTVVCMYPAERTEAIALCGIIILSGVGLAVYAFQQYMTGNVGNDARLSIGNDAFGIDPNHFAANFMLPISIAAMGFISLRNTWIRIVLASTTAIMGVGVLLTGSRGGLTSLGVLFAYILIRTRRVKETLAITAAGLIAGFAFPTGFQRFNDPSQGAASGRFYIWEVARPALLNQMRWIYGNGFASFPDVYDKAYLSVYQPVSAGYGRPGHNLIVQSSVELGIIGLGLVIVAWYWTWRTSNNIPPGTPWYALRVASEAITVALFATALSVDVLWFKYLWLGFSLGALARNVYAPSPLFGRRRKVSVSLPLQAPFVEPIAARTAAASSSSLAAFEHTSVAPEI